MCLKKWVGLGRCIATKNLGQCTVDFGIRVALAFYSSYAQKQFIIYCTQIVEFDHKVVAIFSQVFKVSVAPLYRHIQFFKQLQLSGNNSIVIFVIKDYDFTVLISSTDKNFPFFC